MGCRSTARSTRSSCISLVSSRRRTASEVAPCHAAPRPASSGHSPTAAGGSMRTTRTLAIVIAVAAVSSTAASAQRQQGATKNTTATYAVAEKLSYGDSTLPVGIATVWGNPDKGAFNTFAKFAPGFDAGTHYHSNDVSIV